MNNFYYVSMISVLALVMLIYMICKSSVLKNLQKKYFVQTGFLTIVIIIAETATVAFDHKNPSVRIFHILANVIGFSLTPFIPMLLINVMNNRRNIRKWWVVLPGIMNAIFSIISPWTCGIFSVSDQNCYFRGSMFFIFITVCGFYYALLLIAVFKAIKRYPKDLRTIVIALYIFVLIGIVIQILNPAAHTAWICITFGLIFYHSYLCILVEKFDVTTNVLNRRAYEQELKRLESVGHATIILFDVDNFKYFNDTKGHPYGDYCLYTVATALQEAYSKLGHVFRIGGDEFCFLSERTEEEAFIEAGKVLKERMKELRIENPELPKISYGVAIYRKISGDLNQAVKEADRKLYHFKKVNKQKELA